MTAMLIKRSFLKIKPGAFFLLLIQSGCHAWRTSSSLSGTVCLCSELPLRPGSSYHYLPRDIRRGCSVRCIAGRLLYSQAFWHALQGTGVKTVDLVGIRLSSVCLGNSELLTLVDALMESIAWPFEQKRSAFVSSVAARQHLNSCWLQRLALLSVMPLVKPIWFQHVLRWPSHSSLLHFPHPAAQQSPVIWGTLSSVHLDINAPAFTINA